MLQGLRKGSKHPVAKILLGLVLIAFAGLGLGSFIPSLQMKREYIKAGETDIGIQEISNEFNKIRAELSPNTTINEAIEAGLLDYLVNHLVDEALVMEEARILNLRVTRDQQKDILSKDKFFQDENGQFSSTKFQTALLRSGMTESRYLELIDRMLIKKQLTDSISSSAFIPKRVIEIIAKNTLEKRNGTSISFQIKPIETIKSPSENELKEFFDNSSKSWLEPSRRVANYIYLDPNDYSQDIIIDENTLLEEYKIRKSDYFKDETRTLEQLIFSNQEDALNALDIIKNNIENFSTLFPEKLISIDDIAKSELPEKLAEPVFKAQTNDVSEPIETEFGFHIFKLMSVNPAKEPNLNEIKDQVKKDIQYDKAIDLIYDLANKLDDGFADGSSIQDEAQKHNLIKKSTEPIDINGFNQNREKSDIDPINNKLFLETLWSANEETIPTVIEVGENKFFALELEKEIKEFIPNFNDIKDKIETVWLNTKAIEQTINQVKDLQKLSNDNIFKFAKDNDYKISKIENAVKNNSLPNQKEIVNALFKIKSIGESEITLTKEGVTLVIFDKSIEALNEDIAKLVDSIHEPFNTSMKQDLVAAFIDQLKGHHALTVNKNNILQAMGVSSP